MTDYFTAFYASRSSNDNFQSIHDNIHDKHIATMNALREAIRSGADLSLISEAEYLYQSAYEKLLEACRDVPIVIR